MTTYPLPTLACKITSAGISAPSYQDILLSLQATYAGIYGADVVLALETQDGQWLAIQAAAINDTNMAAIAAYQAKSPATATGTALSSVVKINGLARLVPSNSTAAVTIVGVAGTPISNGLIGDNLSLGTQWAMPALVTIPVGGSITVTATCTTPGATTAAAGTLTVIATPTAGWQTVTNGSNASPGSPIETDPQLRARQTLSTQNPALSIVGAMYGAVASVAGVSALSYDENTTGTTDSNGVPGHTVAFVVEGGAVQDVVNAIGSRKGVGCGTYGTTTGVWTDPATGVPYTIAYTVPTLDTILVRITVTALTGYSSAIGASIKTAIANFITALAIGAPVLLTRLYVPAQLAGPYGTAAALTASDGSTYEVTALTIAVSPGTPGSADLVTPWNHRPVCAPANITLTVV